MERGKRRHNCKAETNVRMGPVVWAGDEIVTTFRCKRCATTWEVRKTTAQIDAEMREQAQALIEEQPRGGR